MLQKKKAPFQPDAFCCTSENHLHVPEHLFQRIEVAVVAAEVDGFSGHKR